MTTIPIAPWRQLYPSSVSVENVHPSSMTEVWQSTVERAGELPAVFYGMRTLSFRDIDTAADALAVAFQACGLHVGDRVAVYLQNDPQWLITLVACWKSGITAVAVNPMYQERELAHVLKDCGARILVCLEELYGRVESVRDGTALEHVITTSPADVGASANEAGLSRWTTADVAATRGVASWQDVMRRFAGHSASPYVPSTDAVAVLTYTSGTTGPSKGAMNLHRNMFHSARVFTDWFDLDSSDVVLGVAPLFHITGLVAGLAVTAMSGAPLILMHRFDAETVTACAERHRATFAVGTSTAFVALCAPDVPRGDVRSLTKVASGGAPLPTGVVARVRETLGIDLRGVYGLTETTSPTHLTPLCGEIPVDAETGVLATGIPVPGAEVRIVSDGIDCAIGDIGEIFVRGPMVVPGYWNLPDESAHAIQDGWLATGDVGRMDRQGWLFVVDRTKDLINAGGYKVWPREVEDVLVAHDAVHDAAVIGIPDQYRGETVKAYVALRPGKQVTAAELIEFCRGRMAAYKYPRHVEFVAEVPKNASGKTLRRALRDN